MNLYIVDYEYYDSHEDSNEKDRWMLSCKDHTELESLMKANEKEFEKCGYNIFSYGYQLVSHTDNGYKISVG